MMDSVVSVFSTRIAPGSFDSTVVVLPLTVVWIFVYDEALTLASKATERKKSIKRYGAATTARAFTSPAPTRVASNGRISAVASRSDSMDCGD